MSIWLDEADPDELRASSPHVVCNDNKPHDAHAWRGTTTEFGGACQVTRTYWCEGGRPALCVRGDDRPVSARRVVLIGPDGSSRTYCGPFCDPCIDELLHTLKPTYTGGGDAYRIDREETR